MSDWEIDIRRCEREDNERKYHYFSQLQTNGVIDKLIRILKINKDLVIFNEISLEGKGIYVSLKCDGKTIERIVTLKELADDEITSLTGIL